MAVWRLRAAVPWITCMGAILGHLLVPMTPPDHLSWPFPARFLRASPAIPHRLLRVPSNTKPGWRTLVGAHVGIRTRDLFLTKEVLCRLSYVGEFVRI